ncbi:hypothetical protein ACLHDF_18770 [Priestia aryabhattai]
MLIKEGFTITRQADVEINEKEVKAERRKVLNPAIHKVITCI